MLPVEVIKDDSYIWHCPGSDCRKKGIVLLKTKEPFLGDGKIKCSKCDKEYSFCDIMKANKKNVEKYLEKLD